MKISYSFGINVVTYFVLKTIFSDYNIYKFYEKVKKLKYLNLSKMLLK